MAAEPYFIGKTTVAPDVLLTIARLTALNVNGVSRLVLPPAGTIPRWIKKGHVGEGVVVEIVDDVLYVDLHVVLKSGMNVREISRHLQHELARSITEMVGMQVGRVNVHIEDIDYPAESEV
jgi:uncharacterized alkaline shock family protein YloU